MSVTSTPIAMPFASMMFAERYEGMLVVAPAEHDTRRHRAVQLRPLRRDHADDRRAGSGRQTHPRRLGTRGGGHAGRQQPRPDPSRRRSERPEHRSDRCSPEVACPPRTRSGSAIRSSADRSCWSSASAYTGCSPRTTSPTSSPPTASARSGGRRRQPEGCGDEPAQLLPDVRHIPAMRRARHLRAAAEPRVPRRRLGRASSTASGTKVVVGHPLSTPTSSG